MLRRVKMALPLVFAFLLTLLPFLVLEFTELQRLEVKKERELYLWQQQANNYLQLFKNLWSFELQLKRRMQVFRRRQGQTVLRHADVKEAFARELKKRLPGKWLPDFVYAGSLQRDSGQFKLFRGNFFSRFSRAVFKKILFALAAEQEFSEAEKKDVNRFTNLALGKDMNIDFLKELRRGKLNGVKFRGRSCLFLWDYIEDEKQKLIYLCFFENDKIDYHASIRSTQGFLARDFPQVLSAMIPIEEADKSLSPILEKRLSAGQIEVIEDICRGIERHDQPGQPITRKTARAKMLPVGLVREPGGYHVIREFVDFLLPYEILLIRGKSKNDNQPESDFLFFMRLGFFSLWLLVFVKVLITGRPLGLSIASWLNLIFMVIGVLPLVVLYIAGSFHMESSGFRQEQQILKNIIRQFEDADVSGEAILAKLRDFCRTIELKPSFRKALQTWDREEWLAEIKKLPEDFEKAGLRFSACYVFPPPIAISKEDPEKRIEYVHHSFYQESSNRDKAMAEFYSDWVDKSYYQVDPRTTNYVNNDLPFFAGEEGDEIMRLFLGNRADSDVMEMGDQRQFFYQNYILLNGRIRNWFFFRANLNRPYENYLKERVEDWISVYSETPDNLRDDLSTIHFALTRINNSEAEYLLPLAKSDDKYLGVVKENAGELIELSAATKARLFRQSDHQICIVYPCQKIDNFVLTAVMDFRNLHARIYIQELQLAIVLVFLAIPVFFISRFIATYLVFPLKQIESGLKRVAEQDFSLPISVKRQDEIGELAETFDKMVKGIIERQNLGRFVSAGLDNKVALETSLSEENLEKNFAVVLCSDIRNFTPLSETYPVRKIVEMLNQHLTAMSEVITSNDGMIEQFIGDAVLAVFTGESESEAAKKAIQAAIAMVQAHAGLVEKRLEVGDFAYEIGVGIEVGKVISGVVKAGERREYVLIGQCRNQSEILEGQSKLGRHSRIVVSPQIRSLAEEYSFIEISDTNNWEVILPGDVK